MFSDAGNTLCKARSNLAPEKVNKLLFIHSIYKNKLARLIETPTLVIDNNETDSETETV